MRTAKDRINDFFRAAEANPFTDKDVLRQMLTPLFLLADIIDENKQESLQCKKSKIERCKIMTREPLVTEETEETSNGKGMELELFSWKEFLEDAPDMTMFADCTLKVKIGTCAAGDHVDLIILDHINGRIELQNDINPERGNVILCTNKLHYRIGEPIGTLTEGAIELE